MARNLVKDSTKHYIGKGTFAFAVNLVGPNPEKIMDPRYFSFKIYFNNIVRNPGLEDRVSKRTIIEYELSDNNFPIC